MNCTMTLLSNLQKSLNDYSSYVWDTFYDDDVEIVTYLHTYEGVYNFRQFTDPFQMFLIHWSGKCIFFSFKIPISFKGFICTNMFIPYKTILRTYDRKIN